MFNVYGITEVSCWASCEAVTADQLRKMREKEESKEERKEEEEEAEKEEEEEADVNGAVSLGQPLSGTCVELRDERGKVITSGSGRIWIGNTRCLY